MLRLIVTILFHATEVINTRYSYLASSWFLANFELGKKIVIKDTAAVKFKKEIYWYSSFILLENVNMGNITLIIVRYDPIFPSEPVESMLNINFVLDPIYMLIGPRYCKRVNV